MNLIKCKRAGQLSWVTTIVQQAKRSYPGTHFRPALCAGLLNLFHTLLTVLDVQMENLCDERSDIDVIDNSKAEQVVAPTRTPTTVDLINESVQ